MKFSIECNRSCANSNDLDMIVSFVNFPDFPSDRSPLEFRVISSSGDIIIHSRSITQYNYSFCILADQSYHTIEIKQKGQAKIISANVKIIAADKITLLSINTEYGNENWQRYSFKLPNIYCYPGDNKYTTQLLHHYSTAACILSSDIGTSLIFCEYLNETHGEWRGYINNCHKPIPLKIKYGLSSITVSTGTATTFYPELSGDFTFYQLSPPTEDIKINKKTGGMTFYSKDVKNVTNYTISMSGGYSFINYHISLDFQHILHQSPVYNLRLEDSIQFVVGVAVNIPFIFDGQAEACFTEGLPPGLNYITDGKTHKIIGIPTKVTNTSILTAYCYNHISSTNHVEITYAVHSNALPGIKAIYWSGSNIKCDRIIKPFENELSFVRFSRIDTNTYHQISENDEAWNDLDEYYRHNFGVYWSGYISINSTGIYGFGIKSQGSYWLYIDNNLIIAPEKCFNDNIEFGEYNVITYTKMIKIEIYVQYVFCHNNFELYIKPPNDDYSLVKESDYYYIPQTLFYYPSDYYTHAYQDSINTTEIRKYDVEINKTLIDSPSLPDHYKLNKYNGIISGYSTEYKDYVKYKIRDYSGAFGYVSIQTILKYPAANQLLSYSGTNYPVTNVVLRPGDFISFNYSTEIHGEYDDIVVEPDLPLGLHLYGSYNWNIPYVINGSCEGPSPTQTYIVCHSGVVKLKWQFQLTCLNSCPNVDEELIVIDIVNYYVIHDKFSFKISDEDNTIFEMENLPLFNEKPTFIACMNVNKKLLLSGITKLSDGVKFNLYVSGSNSSILSYTTPSTSTMIEFRKEFSIELEEPVIEFDKSITISIFDDANIKPNSVSGAITECYITPDLPYGLILKPDCNIKGHTYSTQPKRTYYITPGNKQNNGSTVIINLDVIGCTDEDSLLLSYSFYSGNNPKNIDFVLEDDSGEEIFSKPKKVISTTTYTDVMCIEGGSYYLYMESDNNQGWNGGDIDIFLENTLVGTYSLSENENPVNITLKLNLFIPKKQLFYYYMNEPVDGWYLPKTNIHYWPNTTIDKIPDVNGPAIYIKTDFNVPKNEYLLTVLMEIDHKSGLRVYFNGEIIYNKFLPINTTYDYSNSTFDKIKEISIIVPPSLLKVGESNTLAIELHRHISDSEIINLDFGSIAIISSSECYDIVHGINVLDSSNNSSPYNGIEYAFDGKKDTTWIQLTESFNQSTEQFVKFELSRGTTSKIQMFGFITSPISDYNQYESPVEFILEGINDEGITEIGREENIVTTKPSQEYSISVPFTSNSYNIFEVKMKSNPNYNIQISEVFLRTCLLKMCPAIHGFNETISGVCLPTECLPYYEGSAKKCCSKGRSPKWEDTDYSSCIPNIPTDLSYPFNTYTLILNEPITQIIKPSIKGAEIKYTYKPALSIPQGLLFNENTGEISGTPTELISKTIFVAGYNSRGYSDFFQIDINVIKLGCSGEGNWPSTEAGKTIEISCVDGYTGIRTRECFKGNPPAWSDINTSNCVKNRDPFYPNVNEEYVIGNIKLINEDDIKIDIIKDDIRSSISVLLVTSDNNVILTSNNEYMNVTIVTTESLSERIQNQLIDILENSLIEKLNDINPTLYSELNITYINSNIISYLYPPSNFYYPSSYYTLYVSISVTNIIPNIVGEKVVFILSEETGLPYGLFLDRNTGEISGKPYTTCENRKTEIIATNPSGSLTFTLYITIKYISCPLYGLWPETKINDTVTISCPDGSVGTESRKCIYDEGKNGVKWGIIDDINCGSPTIPKQRKNEVFLYYDIKVISISIDDSLTKDDIRVAINTITQIAPQNILIYQKDRVRGRILVISDISIYQDEYNKMNEGFNRSRIQQELRNIDDYYTNSDIIVEYRSVVFYEKEINVTAIVVGVISGLILLIALGFISFLLIFRCKRVKRSSSHSVLKRKDSTPKRKEKKEKIQNETL